MEAEGLSRVVIDTFAYYYKKVLDGETGLISEREIIPVGENTLESFENLSLFAKYGKKALKHAVMIVLNGGLGTSMGLAGAKSLLKVKNKKSFLEVKQLQAERQRVRLCLMNSFNTHEETASAFDRLNPAQRPIFFTQNKFPKILREDLEPASWPKNRRLEWNPPGHGDVYAALHASGTLRQLLDEDICFAFISNSDNLGATMDPALLGFFAENRFPFMMEVAKRTATDVKGGHLTRLKNGRLILREIAQCPKEDSEVFQNLNIHIFFNTNNVWINLNFLNDLIEKEGKIRLPMILNPKTLDPREDTSPPVYQIETAMGAAVSLFEGATAVKVPRTRFCPVKTCNDLIVVRSDCYGLSSEGNLVANRSVDFPLPKIELDSKFYGKIDRFEKRFPDGVPSLAECNFLKIEGDIRFESSVIVRGSVCIKNTQPTQAVIRQGTVIDRDLEF
jgi:UTP--glucose-1-phosphate uridylyltransferase